MLPPTSIALQTPGTLQWRLVAPDEPCLSPLDRSFHFGDSVFVETRTVQGIALALHEHLQQLHRSAELASIGDLPDHSLLTAMVRGACEGFVAAHGRLELAIRITISRGIGAVTLDRSTSGPPYALVVVQPLSARVAEDTILRVAVVGRRRQLRSALDPAMQSGNALHGVLAMAEAQALGFDDAVLLDYQGFVTDTAHAQLFAVWRGAVWTAPQSLGVQPSVLRAWVLDACAELSIPCVERCFDHVDLRHCQEIFLSSPLRPVAPVGQLDQRPVGAGQPGPVTQQIHAALQARLAAWAQANTAASVWPT